MNVKDILLIAIYLHSKLGSMISDNVKNGLIITTGDLSKEAKDTLKKIKKPYNINVITSNELSLSYSKYILKLN